MDKVTQTINALRDFVGAQLPSVSITTLEVISVEGDTCTVDVEGTPVPGVRLKATKGGNNKVLITPKLGSNVLVGSLSGDWKELAVLVVDEAEKIEIIQDNLTIEIDAVDGKISIKNKDVSLLSLLTSLTGLLKTGYKVYTPAGPSGGALPDTVANLNELETNIKKLLK